MLPNFHKKITQALNYLIEKEKGQINKMKAVRLMYFTERYHLRKHGRPIIADLYLASQKGVLGVKTLDIANLKEDIGEDILNYASFYIGHLEKGKKKKARIISKKAVDFDFLSNSEIESFDLIFNEFAGVSNFQIIEEIYKYPEWSRYKEEIFNQKRKEKICYKDLFLDSKESDFSIFNLPLSHLKTTQEVFDEYQKSKSFFTQDQTGRVYPFETTVLI